MNEILKKIKEIKQETLAKVTNSIQNITDYSSQEYINLLKEKDNLEKYLKYYEDYEKTYKDIEDAKELIENEKDYEMKKFYQEEIERLTNKLEKIEHELWKMLIGESEEDNKNVIIEIRAGTGGEEAALFAADLFRMYSKFADKMKFKIEILNTNYTDLGGIKEISFLVSGKNAYRTFKYESGTHRVQRVPITEASGRIHTSTATVIVLPEMEEKEVVIKDDEIEMETFKAGGPGGQNVNKNECAIRIRHLPTGIVVTCADERSLHQNKMKALKILRAKIAQLEREKQEEELRKQRRQQVKTGDRSEKIRTYNFPQNRVTDHRINLTIQNLESILEGNLEQIIEELQKMEILEKIEEIKQSVK
ncbi:MAG: peptide chain release factor 1 [Candidatus Calescibacterium sp.]|nr:peptide chain release factor 1 [Candidatus Calescibacterium sp.]MCX7971814.1 peptide chain release factor 1 [bacterium]MDW8194928.1 peptide chain release factor 1 [Candidatus Calescibacterium sp.]